MQAIKELYKIGRGPSSSHTLAPERACRLFTKVNGIFDHYHVELFGSLSLTGKGHHTDQIIKDTLPGETKIIFSLEWNESFPNGFYLTGYNKDETESKTWTIFSIGGGSIQIKEYPVSYNDEIYHETSLKEIYQTIQKQNITLLDYVEMHEPDYRAYLGTILDAMYQSVQRGILSVGILPGKLQMKRSAKDLYEQALLASDPDERKRVLLMAYAYGASEENAAGHTVVTSPTLGACGVNASLVYYMLHDEQVSREKMIDALAIGGIFGNVIKANATISGAVGGCQAEIGAAVSMAAAAYAYLLGLDNNQIEYAAEIAMEHNLGLTCDPVMGYVMIPCIERNAMGITRAIDCAVLSKYLSRVRRHLVSFDMVVDTMNETGHQIPIELKETAEGGLAKEFAHAKNTD